MGSAFQAKMVQWVTAITFATNSNQDDLQLITNYGLSYRADDYGNDSIMGENISLVTCL